MKKQGGYLNLDIGGLLVAVAVFVALIAAPVGWLLIEGILWLCQNVQIILK